MDGRKNPRIKRQANGLVQPVTAAIHRRTYFFPETGETVEAADSEEATRLLAKKVKKGGDE